MFSPQPAKTPAAASKTCSAGYVHAIVGGQEKPLRTGEFCSAQYESDYEKYRFSCVSGRLETGATTGTISSTGSGPVRRSRLGEKGRY